MNNLILETLFLCSLPIIVLFIKSLFTYRYWKKKKVPYLKPSFPFGNYTKPSIFRRPFHEVNAEFYNKIKYEMKLPYAGLYNLNKPVLMVTDPELLKYILIKDFDHFLNRGLNDNYDKEKEPMLDNLFNMRGDEWRRLRNKLSPTFTSNKIKYMFPFIEECGQQLVDTMNQKFGDAKEVELEMKDYCTRFTTDVIVSAAFGVEANTLTNPNSTFYWVSQLRKSDGRPRKIKQILFTLLPIVRKFLDIPIIDKRFTAFFADLVKNNMEFREKNNKREDFLDFMIQMKNTQKDKQLAAGDVREYYLK